MNTVMAEDCSGLPKKGDRLDECVHKIYFLRLLSGLGSPDSLGKDFKGFEKPRLAQIEIWKEFGRNLKDFR